jgi:seryl-tRNA synthetase
VDAGQGEDRVRARTLIALLENFQREDGNVWIPAKLAAYTGFQEIAPKAAGG